MRRGNVLSWTRTSDVQDQYAPANAYRFRAAGRTSNVMVTLGYFQDLLIHVQRQPAEWLQTTTRVCMFVISAQKRLPRQLCSLDVQKTGSTSRKVQDSLTNVTIVS